MSPRMRPSSTRRFTPSSAMVAPKVLRRPRASMHTMASTLLLCSFRRPAGGAGIQEFFRFQAEALNGCVDPGPLFGKKFLAFALQQQIARTGFDEHAETSLLLDKLLVDQFLIALQNRERIDPIFGRDIAHRWQRLAFLENSVEYQGDDTVAKLAVNRLTVVPLKIHPVFQITPYERCERSLGSSLARGFVATPRSCKPREASSDIVNYNTSAHASSFHFLFPPFRPTKSLVSTVHWAMYS